ncbi:hypothetical protein CRM22_011331 [Opisthorchis felineus]|uniref:BPTI/Kunitz inhibitor domain-containing protein n=1 Tax=Opisthorchis felineus TaxID=147828 RepID=A0A4S2JMN8_OPIFE|nr:hypothetical protein CRM22_011331 [Opisthorchis felineus]
MSEHLNDLSTPVEHPLVPDTIIEHGETTEEQSDVQHPEVEQSGSPEEADESSEIIPLKGQTGSEKRHVRILPHGIPNGFWRKVPKIVFFIVPILLVTLGVLVFAVYASVTSAHCNSPTETDEQPAGSTNISSKSRDTINPDCLLPIDYGQCRGEVTMYAFDAFEWRCVPFHYSGCEGNKNRFTSLEDCVEQCH